MYTRDHLLVSLAVGVALVLAPLDLAQSPAVVVAAAAVAGTVIDLDHFLVARLRTGTWLALRRGLARPRRLLFAQDELFADGEVGVLHRLLSHVVLGGVAVSVLGLLAPSLALVVGVSLYAHVLADLLADVRSVEYVVKNSA
ncbi:MAG: hypothetical protein ABEI99_07630 [Halobaculum sp.]